MLDKLFIKLQNRSKQSLKLFIALIISFMSLSPHCEAQYFGSGSGFGYNGIGSSLLYPLNSIFYPGYGNAMYGFAALGSSFANNAMYNTFRNIPYGYGYSGGYPYYPANSYPLGAPNINYPLNYNNYNTNQNQTSGWNYSPNQTLSVPQNSNDANDIFNSGSPLNAVDPTSANKTPSLTVAPDRHVLGQTANGQAFGGQTLNGVMPSSYKPDIKNLASDGFFQTVNTRYKGNLFHALNQMDMRAWASSIGLIQTGQQLITPLSSTRKSAVSAIMKDSSLNSQKKIELLHVLLASP